MFVVGEKDRDAGTVAVRDRLEGDLGAMPLAAAIAKLAGRNRGQDGPPGRRPPSRPPRPTARARTSIEATSRLP